MKNDDPHRYDDMLDMPRHVSPRHPQMKASERAAQFSPFAALRGFDEAIIETARLTEERKELSEEQKEILGRKLDRISRMPADTVYASVSYFRNDPVKKGGYYHRHTGVIHKTDSYAGKLVFRDGTVIFFDDIAEISTEEELY